jgi:branched-chain amino acid transport system substrate-binding protein
MMAGDSNFWNLTEGKCESVSFPSSPVVAGYPLTTKTLPTREAFIQRWEAVELPGIYAYDTVRFILSDAILRAGTIETEAVIKALEKTNVETSSARHFVFTSSHDILVGGTVNDPSSDYTVMCIFQWQNGTQVLVKPEAFMKESGATYKYPPWQGPWSNNQTP